MYDPVSRISYEPLNRVKGVLSALLAASLLSGLGIWAEWTPTLQFKDYVPVVALSIAVVSIAWTAYNHMHQHELTDLQIEKVSSELKQYNAWRVISDLEKYNQIRALTREFMLAYLNGLLQAHSIDRLHTLSSLRQIKNIDDIVSAASFGVDNPLVPIYDSFIELLGSLESGPRIRKEFLPHDEIQITYQFVVEHWPVSAVVQG